MEGTTTCRGAVTERTTTCRGAVTEGTTTCRGAVIKRTTYLPGCGDGERDTFELQGLCGLRGLRGLLGLRGLRGLRGVIGLGERSAARLRLLLMADGAVLARLARDSGECCEQRDGRGLRAAPAASSSSSASFCMASLSARLTDDER